MVVRKRRKKNRARGNRTHGAGGTKNRRGSGSRGGVGRAGSHKHKFSKYYMDFGVKRTLKAKAGGKAVNLDFISDSLDKWIQEGKAKKEGEVIIIDGRQLGIEKILGRGGMKRKLRLENIVASKSAAGKIIAVGGTVPGAKAEEAEEEFEVQEEEAEGGEE